MDEMICFPSSTERTQGGSKELKPVMHILDTKMPSAKLQLTLLNQLK